MYDPILPVFMEAHETASGTVESVEIHFPGLEGIRLVQIIENGFKATNIHRRLAREKDRAEAQRMINIEGIELEKSERD